MGNSLLVDMEPKVVGGLLESREREWGYRRDCALVDQMGSGNNWAQGFNYHGPSQQEHFLDKMQLILEPLDKVDGVVIIHSLAGGTGSGLGSYLTSLVKENYSNKMQLNNLAVLPHSSGEVITSTYNSVLTLAHL